MNTAAQPKHAFVISILSEDRIGILAEVTDALQSCGGDLADVSQTVLGGYFSMIVFAALPDQVSADAIKEAIEQKASAPLHLQVMKRTEKPDFQPLENNLYILTAVGKNRTGLVAVITKECQTYSVNIVDLVTTIDNEQYTMMLQLDCSACPNISTFRDHIAQVGQRNGLECVLQHQEIFTATNEM
jgi:predicted amino acid-binding ACT domain protein